LAMSNHIDLWHGKALLSVALMVAELKAPPWQFKGQIAILRTLLWADKNNLRRLNQNLAV